MTATGSTGPSPSATGEPALRVMVIGDSIPFGQGDCGNCVPFVQLYTDSLSDRLGVIVEPINLSTHDGLTSPSLVDRVRTSFFQTRVAAADVVIVSIGHNDTPFAGGESVCAGDAYTRRCAAKSAAVVAGNVRLLLAELTKTLAGKPSVLAVLTVYNDVTGAPQMPPEATARAVRVLDAYEQAMCRTARKAGAACIDAYHAFNGPDGIEPAGDLLAEDYTHPSALGHQTIASLLDGLELSTVTAAL